MIQKISNYDLLRLPIKPGQIYYITDLRCLFQDFGKTARERTRLNALVLNTDYERLHRVRPQNGQNYYVIETNFLWVYDTKWVLKDGDIRKYNAYAYTYTNGVSPVVSNDSTITSSTTGDRIIDNNGLLGNGSVVVRDRNRLNKGIIEVDARKNNVSFTSYLDNGISFYPYGFTSSAEEKQKIGSFHLGIESTVENPGVFENMSHKGLATYYGDINLYGDMFTIEVQPYTYSLNYIPQVDEELRYRFECNVTVNETSDISYKKYSNIEIKVIDATTCKIRITTYNDRSGIVVTDGNEKLYQGALLVESDIIYDGKRTVTDDSVTFKITSLDDSFTLSGGVVTPLITFSNPEKYTDTPDNVYGTSELLRKIKISNYSGKVNILRCDS